MTPTPDLCDRYGDLVSVAEPLFRDFGGRAGFSGEIETVRVVFQEHTLPRGELLYRGQKVEPAAIKRTMLLTVEGERKRVKAIPDAKQRKAEAERLEKTFRKLAGVADGQRPRALLDLGHGRERHQRAALGAHVQARQ